MSAVGSWDIDGVFIGTVEGEPVNCRVRCRTVDHGVEMWIKAAGINRESVVSRAPEVRQMFDMAIAEFHSAAHSAGLPADLVPPIAVGPHLILFPGCRVQDPACAGDECDSPAPDQVERLG